MSYVQLYVEAIPKHWKCSAKEHAMFPYAASNDPLSACTSVAQPSGVAA